MAKSKSRKKSAPKESHKSSEPIPEVTADNLLQRPWNLWRDLGKSDAFFRQNLSNSLYFTLQLRLFRKYIQDELAKKRSRKSAAVRRAYRHSKNDAKKILESQNTLDLDQLWKTLETKFSLESKALNERLNGILAKNPSRILKTEPDEELSEPVYDAQDAEAETGPEEDESEESFSDEGSESPEPGEQPEIKPKPSAKNIEDRFFKLEEMEAFADQEPEEGEDIDYFDSLGEESDDSVAAADMKYSDFFRDPDKSDGDDEEDLKPLSCEKHSEGMDEYDREMEMLLQKLEDEDAETEEEAYRDEIEEPFEMESDSEEAEQPDAKTINENDLRISQVEHELVAPKHWSLMGESTAKERPRNSLLDLELELPQTASVIYEQAQEAQQEHQEEQLPIELIIAQRIKSGVFDNVERKLYEEDQVDATERLKKNKQEELDFSKNEMGLGEVYAQKYRDQFMAIDKLDAHKKELAEQFAKLVYKLDALSNASFVPKRVSESEKANALPVISVETPINVVLSEPPKEMPRPTPSKVSRSTKKRKFKNKMKGLVKSGRLTLEQVKGIRDKMTARNRKTREDAKSKRETGLTAGESTKHEMRARPKVRAAELLANVTS